MYGLSLCVMMSSSILVSDAPAAFPTLARFTNSMRNGTGPTAKPAAMATAINAEGAKPRRSFMSDVDGSVASSRWLRPDVGNT